MKISTIIRSVAILFVIIIAILLLLMVLDLINSVEIRDAIYKLTAVCGIIAAAAISIMFLSKKK